MISTPWSVFYTNSNSLNPVVITMLSITRPLLFSKLSNEQRDEYHLLRHKNTLHLSILFA